MNNKNFDDRVGRALRKLDNSTYNLSKSFDMATDAVKQLNNAFQNLRFVMDEVSKNVR